METHILFFILAGLLIAILIGYSLWSARREKSRIFSNTFATRPVSTPISASSTVEVPESLNTQGFQSAPEHEPYTPDLFEAHQQEIDNRLKDFKISLQDQPESQPAAANPIFTSNPVEPHAEPQVQLEQPASPQIQLEQPQAEAQPVENNIITLYVVAPEGQQFNGESVVQNLEALGLHHGEYQIFHRHIDNANSPVLFSVANMMQPGIFDLSQIHHFSTIGLVFFMQLPSPTNDVANLRIMINTVETLAQSLGGFVLNDQQQLFDEQSRQQYILRVKQQ